MSRYSLPTLVYKIFIQRNESVHSEYRLVDIRNPRPGVIWQRPDDEDRPPGDYSVMRIPRVPNNSGGSSSAVEKLRAMHSGSDGGQVAHLLELSRCLRCRYRFREVVRRTGLPISRMVMSINEVRPYWYYSVGFFGRLNEVLVSQKHQRMCAIVLTKSKSTSSVPGCQLLSPTCRAVLV